MFIELCKGNDWCLIQLFVVQNKIYVFMKFEKEFVNYGENCSLPLYAWNKQNICVYEI